MDTSTNFHHQMALEINMIIKKNLPEGVSDLHVPLEFNFLYLILVISVQLVMVAVVVALDMVLPWFLNLFMQFLVFTSGFAFFTCNF
jgi:hypothetical protein